MSPVKYLVYGLVILVMLVLSAFFSGSEISFNTANKMRLRKAAESGSRRARLACKISDHFTTALSAILIGNNLANIAASTAATSIAIALLANINGGDALASTLATIIMTVIVLIFGEIVPKLLCKQHADTVVLWVAIPVLILTIILIPAVAIVMGLLWLLRLIWGKDKSEGVDVTEEELSSIIDTVEEEGVIDEGQSDLLQSTLEFHETTIEEVMTPRIDLTTIDIDDDREAIIETVENSKYSRLPVYEDSIDNIIGVLYLNHYYREAVDNPDVDIRSLLMKPCFLHKTMHLPDALRHLRDRRTHIAIVIDEFGGTMGVVTIEDILEELVGDIWDESDEIVTDVVKTGENTYEVLGEANIYDFFNEIDYEPRDFESEYSTVGGWAVENLNSDPHVGDSFTCGRLYVIVTEMDDMRVTKVTAVLNKPSEDEDEDYEGSSDDRERDADRSEK